MKKITWIVAALALVAISISLSVFWLTESPQEPYELDASRAGDILPAFDNPGNGTDLVEEEGPATQEISRSHNRTFTPGSSNSVGFYKPESSESTQSE